MGRSKNVSFRHTPAGIFLLLLLGADAAFVGLHLANELAPTIDNRLYSLHVDRSHSEVFQYLQLLWIGGLLVLVGWMRRAPVYGAWALLFAYLAADDALRIHERGGAWLEATWSIEGALGLRGQDFGELTISAGAGLVLFSLIGAAYGRSDAQAKNASQDLALLLGVLVFFGVFFDLLHVVLDGQLAGPLVGAAFDVLEDGGEMVAASLTTAYAFWLRLARGVVETTLLRRAFAALRLRLSSAPLSSAPASAPPSRPNGAAR